MDNENATQEVDALEEASIEAQEENDLSRDSELRSKVSVRDKMLEDIASNIQEGRDEGLESEDAIEEVKGEPVKAAAPDLPVWHDGEQWVTKIKVNGEELQVPFDSLKTSHQKDRASQKKFEAAAEKEQELFVKEQQLRSYAEELQKQQPSKEDAAQKSNVEFDSIINQYHDALYQDDSAKATELLKTLTNSGRGTATQSMEEVVSRALKSYDESKKAESTAKERASYHKSLEEAIYFFEENYKDIASSPELRAVADNQTVILTQENPEWTPMEIVKTAAEYTKEWAGSINKTSDGRVARKKRIVNQPKSMNRSSSGPEEQKILTPSEIIEEMKTARGQVL